MRGLIIGRGEVGRALFLVLMDTHEQTKIIDTDNEHEVQGEQFDIIHICFPYSDLFITEVVGYQQRFSPKYTIIHSTIPVGTSRKVNAIHSPIIGQHPHLEEAIKIFPKMVSGEKASEVADYFRKAGLKVILFDNQETTEAGKLFLTEYYRVCIEFCQRVKKYCDKNNLNFHEVYTLANWVYNEGYIELGHSEFVRPILQPIMGKIGGHCVSQNKDLIDG